MKHTKIDNNITVHSQVIIDSKSLTVDKKDEDSKEDLGDDQYDSNDTGMKPLILFQLFNEIRSFSNFRNLKKLLWYVL